MKIHPPMNLHLIKPTVHVVDRKSKNNVVGIGIISRCPSLNRCLVLPHPCGCKKKKDMSILRLARSIVVCKWHQWHQVVEKDQSFFLCILRQQQILNLSKQWRTQLQPRYHHRPPFCLTSHVLLYVHQHRT